MTVFEDWYDDVEPDASGLDGELFDPPVSALDRSRVPSKSGGLPIDPDLVAILAGENGLVTKPGVAGIVEGITDGMRRLIDAVVAALTGNFQPFLDLVGELPIIGGAVEILEDVLTALKGEYTGSDPVLQGIQAVTAPLRIILDPITGLVRGVLLPGIPIGKLEDAAVNLLEEGAFSDAPSGSSGTWAWDGTRGRTANGSATLTGPAVDELISPLVSVTAGKQVNAEGFVSSLAGSAGTVTVRVRWWNSQAPIGDAVVGMVTLPAAGWSMVSTQLVPPTGSTHATVHVEADITAGQVWVDDLMVALPSGTLPQSWIQGLIPDLAGVRGWIQDLINAVIRALRGVPIVGGTLADMVAELAGLKQTAQVADDNAQAAQSAVTTVQQIFAVRSSRPLWESLDPTGEVSFPLALLADNLTSHTHSFSVVVTPGIPVSLDTGSASIGREHHVDASRSVGGCVRVEAAVEKGTITFMARRESSVSGFYVDLYRMNPDGSYTLIHSSENVAPDLFSTMAWMQVTIPPTLVELGDVLMVQFRASQRCYIAGVHLPVPPNPFGFRPTQFGMTRATADAPPVMTSAVADNAYSADVPFVAIGSNVGQVAAARSFYDNFNRSDLGRMWALRRGSVGGAYLSIKNSRLVNTSSMLLGSQASAIYTLALTTDAMGVEWDQATTTSRISGCMIGANNNGEGGAYLYVTSSNVTLGRFVNSNSDAEALQSGGEGGPGRYRLEYEPAANRYLAWRNDVLIINWTDSAVKFAHGQGRRFAGVNIYHNSFTSGGEIDNFHAYDILQEES